MTEQPEKDGDQNITENPRMSDRPKFRASPTEDAIVDQPADARVNIARPCRRWRRRLLFYAVFIAIVAGLLSLYPGRILPNWALDWFDPPRPGIVNWQTAEQLDTIMGRAQFPAHENKSFIIIDLQLPARPFLTTNWGGNWEAVISSEHVSLTGPDGLLLAPQLKKLSGMPAAAPPPGFPPFPEWFPPSEVKMSGNGPAPNTFAMTLAFALGKDALAKGGLAVRYKSYSTPLVK